MKELERANSSVKSPRDRCLTKNRTPSFKMKP
jgi:hypothetical protein